MYVPRFSVGGCLGGEERNGSREIEGLNGIFAVVSVGGEYDVDMALCNTRNGCACLC